MWRTLKDLSLGLGLLAAASAALLFSDLSSRETATPQRAAGPVPVALLQYASNPVFEETARGIIEGLASRGFKDGEAIRLQKFNAEGDLPTANLIASRITDGSFRLAATMATVCLQAVANANRSAQTTQVFCAVSDPVVAGAGIKALGSLDKPPQLTGIGTSQPVEDIFRLAKRIRPQLKTVGVVWNPAEANSEACTRRARAVCKELGVELLEASIETTRDVKEAAQSLAVRGAQAYWTGGDATVINAFDTLAGVARANRIPVFSNISGHAKRGALFDLGANYYQVGFRAGEIAGEILAGRPASEIAVEDYMPRHMAFNLKALAGLKESWQPQADVLAEAAAVIREDGTVESRESAPPQATRKAPARSRPFVIAALSYTDSVPVEESLSGFRRGLEEAGFKEPRDYVWQFRCAQGDMALLPSLFAAAELDKPDLYAAFSTPVLQNALKRVKGTTPVVFAHVADPVYAGAGKSLEDHRPNITGVAVRGPYEEMADLLATYFPQWKRVGSLVTPAEDNSVNMNEVFKKILARRGITLVNVPVNQSSELTEAAGALCRQGIDAVVQAPDNLVSAGFSAIAGACRRSRMPLLGLVKDYARHGAAITLSSDYEDTGHDAGLIAARVLRGENPAGIPFALPSKKVLTLNPAAAQAQGIALPPALLEKADHLVK